MDALLEDRAVEDILRYFAEQGLLVTVHTRPPDTPTPDRLRQAPRPVRQRMLSDTATHWAALGSVSDHYGSGSSVEEAIRSAARRYRVEQSPGDAGP